MSVQTGGRVLWRGKPVSAPTQRSEVGADKLRALVQGRMDELGVGEREAARRSGGGVSYETLRSITRGAHGGKATRRMSDRVVNGIATALNLKPVQIYEALEISTPDPWTPPESAHRLTPRQRRLVEEMIGAFVAANEAHLTARD